MSTGHGVAVVGSGGVPGVPSVGRSSGVGSSRDGGLVGDSHGDLLDSMDWSVDGLADGLDGVGPGLVHDGLADGLVGPDWAVDLLGAEGWDVLEDGLRDVVSLDDGGGLVGGDGSWDVSVGGLSHGVGQGGDLGDDLSEGVGLGGGVGEVASQPVVLDGGGVMGRGPDQVGGGGHHAGGGDHHAGGGDLHGSRAAESDESGEEQEGVHGGC